MTIPPPRSEMGLRHLQRGLGRGRTDEGRSVSNHGGVVAHQHVHPADSERPAPGNLRGHHCGNLFGCGDENGTGILREDMDGAFYRRAADRLSHRDDEQQHFDGYLSARGRRRRQLLRASTFMGALSAVGPWFDRLAQAAGGDGPAPGTASATGGDGSGPGGDGRIHVVPSTRDVRLGVFDATLPPS